VVSLARQRSQQVISPSERSDSPTDATSPKQPAPQAETWTAPSRS
jgi:hypothetical protein